MKTPVLVLAGLVVFAFTGAVEAAEFRVNTYTTSYQNAPSVAMDSDGNFVVAWQSYGQDGGDYGIYAQRYDAAGNVVGNEFRVNTSTSYIQHPQKRPSVAMDADGDFVVAWDGEHQDGDDFGIYAQRYDSDGNVAGGEFQVNSYTAGDQVTPSIAMDADGDFVVTWRSQLQDGDDFGVYAQRYDSNGNTAGGEFRVNTYTTSYQYKESVAMDSLGNFVVAWESDGQDGSFDGVYAQRYDSNGNTVGAEFRVNTHTAGDQHYPSVAMDADGDFVVAWTSVQDANGDSINAQRYDSDGNTVGGEFLVNTYTIGNQYEPFVAMDSDGDFVVAWQSYEQDGDGAGIYAQRYDSDGNELGGEFRVNTYTTDWQLEHSLAMDADGDFVAAWRSNGQDGSGSSVYADINVPEPATLALILAGGLLLLRTRRR